MPSAPALTKTLLPYLSFTTFKYLFYQPLVTLVQGLFIMKKVVWKNKSNNQLCITIPKNSGLKEGDLVDIKKGTIKQIAYSGVVADLFHYGYLQSLLFAKSIADYNIVGIITDEAAETYRVKPICTLQERKAILEQLQCVDRVMTQHARDHTENLKRIHEEFPEAEIILVHGDDLEDVPGAEYIKSIGGRVVKHLYYTRLSNFKIINALLEQKDQFKDVLDLGSYIKSPTKHSAKNKIIISSKADTLKALQPLLTKSSIEPLYSFTISDWKNDKHQILQNIQKQFSPHKIVIRSSAVTEDTFEKSMAGYFESVLNINTEKEPEIEMAISKVINSYQKKGGESSFNQILVQRQTENIQMSGVLFTRTLRANGPYYVINYDDQSGSSDSVTSGKEHQCIYISQFTESIPEKMRTVLGAVKEIEELIPNIPLDIEFAITQRQNQEKVVIFQVRPLAANLHAENVHQDVKEKISQLKSKFQQLAVKPEHLEGETTFFGDMPDWNPAEIIGDHPHHLDYSLYDYLITNSAWHEARTSQGYYNVKPAKLVELFGNKPYVNVRNTFNSFTPASISPLLRQKLLHFYLNKLQQHPHLQDKVEFEILLTCYDLNFSQHTEELKEFGFQDSEIEELRQSLQELTNHLVIQFPQNSDTDIKTVLSLEQFRKVIITKIKTEENSAKELLNYAKVLLDECRKKGTVQFSRLARLAFIGKALMKSLVYQKITSQNDYDQFYNSISTVATKMSLDFRRLMKGEMQKEEFVQEYYHLRPGTYDITSPRYEQNVHLMNDAKNITAVEEKKVNTGFSEQNMTQITTALRKEGLQFDALHLLSFVEKSTEAREFSKFEFTKNLSEALELIAQAGEKMGFTRKEIALLDINDIFRINVTADLQETTLQWKQLIKEKEKEQSINQRLVLPSLIFSPEDFDIIQHYQAKPNFITQKSIQNKAVYLNGLSDQTIPDLENSIVILENGDPGYDWIFTRNIAGLITKYGGVASHMSIRCAEFGLPAAIGCGEAIFNQIKDAQNVMLNCKENKIIPLGDFKC